MTRARHEDVADALKATPPELSEFRMTAMERQLVDSVRSGHRPSSAGVSRWAVAGGAVIAAAAAWLMLAREPSTEPESVVASLGDPMQATFALYADEVAGSSGPLTAGSDFLTAEDERVEIEQGASVLRLEPSSEAVFHVVDDDAIEVELGLGRLAVEFHPAVPGEQPLRVDTPAARVEVVGTVFQLDVSPEGDTRVEVSEGVVAVTSKASGERTVVNAGEERVVEISPADESVVESAQGDEVDAAEEASGPADDAGPRRLSATQRFRRAERSFDDGDYDAVRSLLLPLAGRAAGGEHAARALTVVAESHARQGNFGNAAEAYRRAAEMASGGAHGANAAFALGRLLERSLGDEEGAKGAYRQYLADAPGGALTGQAEDALCRLGDDEACEGE